MIIADISPYRRFFCQKMGLNVVKCIDVNGWYGGIHLFVDTNLIDIFSR
jgi:hypothetical protein